MDKRKIAAILMISAAVWWAGMLPTSAQDQLPTKSAQSCLKCHEYTKLQNLFAGIVADVSKKANTIQLKIDNEVEVLYFDDKTMVKNASSAPEIPKESSVRIVYYKKDGRNFAKEIEVKKGIDVPKDQLATVEEVAALVAQGPEKGNYVLLDSRPKDMYDEGHIPTAKPFPFFAFDAMKDQVLPKDKEVLQIYYCAGYT
ncbi:MAG: rhodanese-like domain-containing protein [Desulfomonile sp.]|nr:rhodanese-like domain-containing protein [Desulfomonile sp.]